MGDGESLEGMEGKGGSGKGLRAGRVRPREKRNQN